MAELLTPSIAYAYNQKAKALPYNGMQDIGERRRLRQDLQERCGITELEAINILNGFHIDTYCVKYLRKAREAAEGTPEPTKKKAFYNSSEWKATRARVLARDTGIDIYLYITEGRVVPADTVHHIVELMEDYSKRCDLDNLISISEATHSMISKAYKDEIKKAQMQQTLRECISEYKKRLAG